MNKREENGLSENKRLKSEDLAKLSLSNPKLSKMIMI